MWVVEDGIAEAADLQGEMVDERGYLLPPLYALTTGMCHN